MKTIYDLELHEQLRIPNPNGSGYAIAIITRVAGGWIYEMFGGEESSITFIPYNDEFNETFTPF